MDIVRITDVNHNIKQEKSELCEIALMRCSAFCKEGGNMSDVRGHAGTIRKTEPLLLICYLFVTSFLLPALQAIPFSLQAISY